MSRAHAVAALTRKVEALQAKLRAQETAWMRDPAQWEAHVAAKTCRRAIENAARKHGRMLGPTFCDLLAARLECVDVAIVDGVETRPTREQAAALVERWASEGPRAKASAQHRRAA